MERETWRILSDVLTRLDRNIHRGRKRHSHGRILRVYLWAAVNNRAVYWACDPANWTGVRRPRQLPNQSTMSRRMRCADTRAFLRDFVRVVAMSLGRDGLCKIIDGKPFTVARHSQDRDATFGRGAGGMARGYKLHAIYAHHDAPLAWTVTPLNRNESVVARELLPQLRGEGYLLGDAQYEVNRLHELAAANGHVLIAPRRRSKAKGLGHRHHSEYRKQCMARIKEPTPFITDLMTHRRTIETRFANLTNYDRGLTCLPPFVRGLTRVTNWVDAKLAQRAARSLVARNATASA